MERFNGKVVIVTGAASGIAGRVTRNHLAQNHSLTVP